jgi:uncharacterized protein
MGADWLLPVYGLVVGVLVGLTGMGGGVLMTPLLMLGLGMPATAAVGTDLAYSTLTKLAGAWQHWRQGTVEGRVVRALAIGSLPATLVAVALLFWLQGQNAGWLDLWLQRAIGVMLCVAAVLMLLRVLRGRGGHAAAQIASSTLPTARIVAIGALGGFLVGLTSIGSGSLIIALLVMTITLRPERLVGTDIAHAFLLVGVAAAGHLYFLGDVDLALAAKLLVGSVPGVLIGSRLTLWVPRRPLQIGLAGLLLSTAYRLLHLPFAW